MNKQREQQICKKNEVYLILGTLHFTLYNILDYKSITFFKK